MYTIVRTDCTLCEMFNY